MAACLHKTYGVPEKAFSKSRKSLELDKVAKNLSGDKNPGSRLLLDEMKSRKNTGENFKELIINFSTLKYLVLESIQRVFTSILLKSVLHFLTFNDT